jgi:hypothetical protein
MDLESEPSVNESDVQLSRSPSRLREPLSPIVDRVPRALINLVDEAASQLKLVTLPNDASQLKFLNSIEAMPDPLEKITAFVNFLVQKVASTALETTKMFREMQRARDELRISENRASRLLLHLQQNVKLLTRVATQEGETTIVQEAAQNMASVSELDCPVSPTYLKQLKQVLSGPADRLAGLEVLELLKQEIAINSVLRRQTTKLFEMSTRLTQSIELLKSEFKKKERDPIKEDLRRSQAALETIAGTLKCQVADVEVSVARIADENAAKQRMIELLKSKHSELIKKNSEQANELEIVKHELQQHQESEKRGQKVRMQLQKELEQSVKATSEIDALIFAASMAIPIIEAHKNVCQLLETNSEQAASVVAGLKAENDKFKQVIEQNRVLMTSQAETIQTLQDSSWKQWGINLAGSLELGDAESMNDTDLQEAIAERVIGTPRSTNASDELQLETDIQFSELKGLNEQFTSIERELDDLRQQIGVQYDPK